MRHDQQFARLAIDIVALQQFLQQAAQARVQTGSRRRQFALVVETGNHAGSRKIFESF